MRGWLPGVNGRRREAERRAANLCGGRAYVIAREGGQWKLCGWLVKGFVWLLARRKCRLLTCGRLRTAAGRGAVR